MSNSKKEAKTKVADLVKFSCNNAKEQYKAALASYVQFLITSGEHYRNRLNLMQWIDKVGDEIFDLIDFD